MNSKELKSNRAIISGEISSDFTFNHEIKGEKFYLVYVNVPRKSTYIDKLPVIVSEKLIDVTNNLLGLNVKIQGEYRSYNYYSDNNHKLILFVFAEVIEVLNEQIESDENNFVCIEGFITKKPIYRVTPKGRELTEILLAVNRKYRKTSYIPCILWGRNAVFANRLEVGTRCKMSGRIQSREYTKKIDEINTAEMVAYEISVNELEVLKNE